jgi:putative transposase
MSNPFRYFNSSPEVIRLVVMMYVRYPLSLRNVEDLLAERGIDISHETVRFWWNRFGPMFAAEIRKRRVAHMRGYPQWRWHLDEVFVKVNGRLGIVTGTCFYLLLFAWKWEPKRVIPIS